MTCHCPTHMKVRNGICHCPGCRHGLIAPVPLTIRQVWSTLAPTVEELKELVDFLMKEYHEYHKRTNDESS